MKKFIRLAFVKAAILPIGSCEWMSRDYANITE